MKANTHPDYHDVTIVQTDGTSYQMRTTWGKPGDTMRLDVDPLNHPAWQGGTQKVVERAQLSKFEKRFGTFLSGNASGGEKIEAKADAKPEATKPEAKKEPAKGKK